MFLGLDGRLPQPMTIFKIYILLIQNHLFSLLVSMEMA